jgi:dsRNA-specific ribonuclease
MSTQNLDDIIETEEELIFNPFNPLNKEVPISFVCDILKKYGVPDKVHNINLYKRSFVHKSYCKKSKEENILNNITIAKQPYDCIPLKTKSNERLEFLGDGVLECITKYYLYRRFPKENEGFMTTKKIALVKNETIGRMAYEMGLNKYYVLSKNAEEKKTRTNLKKLGCLFEAFLGALFLDFNKISIHDDDKWFDNVFVTGPGFQIAQIFVENIFEKHVNWTELINTNDNYKNLLQVQLQQNFKVTPIYKEISDWDEEEGYHMGVYLAINYQSHEIVHDKVISINHFMIEHNISMNMLVSSNNIKEPTKIQKIKLFYDNECETNEEVKIIIFLSDSKHKIKKKAEQTACKLAYYNLTTE